ncbi:2994_t:CDS:2, partial [Entrophospora sp. SA101]
FEIMILLVDKVAALQLRVLKTKLLLDIKYILSRGESDNTIMRREEPSAAHMLKESKVLRSQVGYGT